MSNSTASFNWSLLDRYSIAEFLYTLSPEIVKQPLTVSQFHKKLTDLLKKNIPVRVRKSYHKKVDKGYVYIGGTYYSDYDLNNQKCVEVILLYKNEKEKLVLSSKRFSNICRGIADTILHEIIHMRQFRRRNFKYLPDYNSNAEKTEQRQEQGYLGCLDEIDAYGFNIACELMDKFKNNKKMVVNYLNENQKGVRRRHNAWRMYLKAFDHDHRHPIIQRVKKKAVRYLTAAEVGKPYKNKDWINW